MTRHCLDEAQSPTLVILITLIVLSIGETEASLLSWIQSIGNADSGLPPQLCAVSGSWSVPRGWLAGGNRNYSTRVNISQHLIGPGMDYRVELHIQNIPYVGDLITDDINETSLAMTVSVPRVNNSRYLQISCVRVSGQDTLFFSALPLGKAANNAKRKLYKMTREVGYVMPNLTQLELDCHCGRQTTGGNLTNLNNLTGLKRNASVERSNWTSERSNVTSNNKLKPTKTKKPKIVLKRIGKQVLGRVHSTNGTDPSQQNQSVISLSTSSNHSDGNSARAGELQYQPNTVSSKTTIVQKQVNVPLKVSKMYTTELTQYGPTNMTVRVQNVSNDSSPLLASLNITDLDLGNNTNFENTSIISSKTTAQKTVTVQQIVISQPKPQEKPQIVREVVVRNNTTPQHKRRQVRRISYNNTLPRSHWKSERESERVASVHSFEETNVTQKEKESSTILPVEAIRGEQLPTSDCVEQCANASLLASQLKLNSRGRQYSQWSPQPSKTKVTIEIESVKPGLEGDDGLMKEAAATNATKPSTPMGKKFQRVVKKANKVQGMNEAIKVSTDEEAATEKADQREEESMSKNFVKIPKTTLQTQKRTNGTHREKQTKSSSKTQPLSNHKRGTPREASTLGEETGNGGHRKVKVLPFRNVTNYSDKFKKQSAARSVPKQVTKGNAKKTQIEEGITMQNKTNASHHGTDNHLESDEFSEKAHQQNSAGQLKEKFHKENMSKPPPTKSMKGKVKKIDQKTRRNLKNNVKSLKTTKKEDDKKILTRSEYETARKNNTHR